MKEKIFYFDIDGTVLEGDTGRCKQALASGALERAVKACGFDQVICVGNLCYIISSLEEMGERVEPMRMVFEICGGAFADLRWMEQNLQLMKNPTARGSYMDFQSSFYYVDDLAEYYLRMAGLSNVFEMHAGKRILVPEPNSTGTEILSWLDWCARQE